MEAKQINGRHIFIIDGKWFDTSSGAITDAQFGLLVSDLQIIGRRGLGTVLAQFYMMVGPGLILTRHIFRGLNRGLYCDDNAEGDKEKLIYSRKPAADYEWIGGSTGRPVKRPPPTGKVFAVIISPNERHKKEYPMIAGWVDRWNWIGEDSVLPDAPIDWLDRYDERLWSRN